MPTAPVRERMWDGTSAWSVTRHDDVTAVLGDPRMVVNTVSLPGGGPDAHAELLVKVGVAPDLAPHLSGTLTHLDPPDHTRLRRLVAQALSTERVAALRPRVRALVDDLLDALPEHAEDGAVDVVEHFASPLPIGVLCALLGVPQEGWARWRGWSRACASTSPRALNAAIGDISRAVRELAAARRKEPADDLVTGLTQARDERGGRLDDTELVTMVLALVIGGHETTAHLVSNGVAALLTHPEQLAKLRTDPDLMPGAVRELLRLYGPAATPQPRYATQDVTVGGVEIPAGACVHARIAVANRDPAHFPRPDALDIARTSRSSHLAYATGPHACLGEALANQVVEVALRALFERFPALALAVPPAQLAWKANPVMLQLVRLPVALGQPG
ncbi:cytochrome P450 [Streptomyces sp. NPDC017979]|uniref:cytochrome P450 n=1 Tax=Streptomyces sp. NPDC017979 TaxID=3365024 RepID=UPI0037B4F1BD